MATLFERMTGVGVAEPGELRISIHGVVSSFYELHRGNLTVQGIITMFNLTAPQQTHMQTIWQAISSSADPASKISEFFDYLLIADITRRRGGSSDYTIESNFWARIDGFS